MLLQGRYARVLRQYPHIRAQYIPELAQELYARVPVATGMLRASVRIEFLGRSPQVSLGPEPFNRARLLAQQAGRTYTPRKRRPKLSRYYALPANANSRRVEYLEDSIEYVSIKIEQECQMILRAEQDIDGGLARIGRTLR